MEAQCRESKDSPGPAPKSANTRIEAAGAGTKVIVDQALADGTVRHWEFTANYDGKDSPVTGNNPDADTVARTRIDANTVQTIAKKAGKVHDDSDVHRFEGREDQDGHDQRCQCGRTTGEQRRGVRKAVA